MIFIEKKCLIGSPHVDEDVIYFFYCRKEAERFDA